MSSGKTKFLFQVCQICTVTKMEESEVRSILIALFSPRKKQKKHEIMASSLMDYAIAVGIRPGNAKLFYFLKETQTNNQNR